MNGMNSYLTNKCCDPDDIINWVGEKSNKDIALPMDFSGVYLIEQRHHNECVKDHSEMYRGRGRM